MMIKAIWGPTAHRSKERGAAAVEFAIVIGLLVLITGGIIEFGRVFWYYDALTKATRDGARLMSDADVKTIGTVETSVRALVVPAANAAGLSPPLANGNVLAKCLDVNYNPITCQNDVAPANVRVEITGYYVTFGSWFAIPLPAGNWFLRPHTTMRYMR